MLFGINSSLFTHTCTILRQITHTPLCVVALVPIDLHTLLATTSSCNYQSILALFSAPNKRRFALRRVFIFGTAKSIMGSNGDEFGIFARRCVLEDHPRSCCEQAGSGLWFISRSQPSCLVASTPKFSTNQRFQLGSSSRISTQKARTSFTFCENVMQNSLLMPQESAEPAYYLIPLEHHDF